MLYIAVCFWYCNRHRRLPPGHWLLLNIGVNIAPNIEKNIEPNIGVKITLSFQKNCPLTIAQCTLQSAQCQSQWFTPLRFTGRKIPVSGLHKHKQKSTNTRTLITNKTPAWKQLKKKSILKTDSKLFLWCRSWCASFFVSSDNLQRKN